MAEFSKTFYAPALGLKRSRGKFLHAAGQPDLPNEGVFGENFRPTRHGSTSMQRRAISRSDAKTIRRCGTMIGDLIYFLSNKDTDAEIGHLKQELRAIQKRGGHEINFRNIVADDTAPASNGGKVYEETAALKQRIREFARLRNRIAIFDGDVLVTCYPARPKDVRRFRRRSFQQR
jgi:hypothetical protein